MRKKDSSVVKQLKELEKLVNEISDNIDFSKVRKNKDLSEQARLVFDAYDSIEEILYESLSGYKKIIRSLDIQALVDDE
jgi:hypothetical protein